MSAPFTMFDALYIHYDKINKNELNDIVKYHSEHSSIVLVTKLNKRHLVQDISVNFAQVLYEPITFSKVEKSFNYLLESKEKIIDNVSNKKILNSKTESFSDIHALVVEDNPVNQKMIQHTLKNIGITTECADNGREGLNMYVENPNKFDVIFMDIQMPIMNGIEATQAILLHEKQQNIVHTPIIAVTANALKGDRERFMSEGMDEYVSKPIDLKKFITALNHFFEADNNEEIPKLSKDILLYKETAMEAKIIAAILKKLDYSVDVVGDTNELKKVINTNSYKCILLDKVINDEEHSNISSYIKSKNIPSLLFVDRKAAEISSDKENFTFISDKITDYISIKEKVDQMIELANVS